MDAPEVNSHMMSVQRLQDEALEAFGFRVKNTFIDTEGPSNQAAARRAHSAPTTPRLLLAGRSATGFAPGITGCHSIPITRRADGNRSPCASPASQCCSRTLSPASTTYHSDESSSDSDSPFGSFCSTSPTSPSSPWGSCTSPSLVESTTMDPQPRGFRPSAAAWADEVETETEMESETEQEDVEDEDMEEEEKEDSSAELAALVESKCSFLRLMGHDFYSEVNEVRKRRGVVKCVVFYVRYLPWAKRAKWLLPLLWAVAKVLNAHGCTTKVQAGELYAQLPGEGSAENNFVRFDFAAARA